jgi:large subunit ribosomal protein L25
MADVLEVEKREQVGSSASRKLRRDGRVPVVLYGHGEESAHLSVPAQQVKMLLRHHSKTVELAGAIKEPALVSEVHWDPLGIEVLHMDLIRVNLKELVDVTVPIQTHGDPVGLREGGILIENVHNVDIRCPAGSIPENLGVNINELHLGGNLTANDLELPEGVELVTPAETVVVHIEEPKAVPEPDEEVAQGAEPEVIAKGGEKTEEGED